MKKRNLYQMLQQLTRVQGRGEQNASVKQEKDK
jgi:hypothetical protein